jgi:hypothetical protein
MTAEKANLAKKIPSSPKKSTFSGARVSSISSISCRGDGLDPNLLYPPLEEEGPPLFSHFS